MNFETINKAAEEFTKLYSGKVVATEELKELKEKLDKENKKLIKNKEKIESLKRDIDEKQNLINQLEASSNLLSEVHIETSKNLQETKSGTPILFFPLRTEVKFSDDYLLVRVYPDTIAIEQHEAELTQAELDAGKYYWKNRLKYEAKNDDESKLAILEQELWAYISNTFGAPRAEWLIQQTRPDNWSQRSGTELIFPQLTTKDSSWTKAAGSRVMPDRLMLFLKPAKPEGSHEELEIISLEGNSIPKNLATSPDPLRIDTYKNHGQIPSEKVAGNHWENLIFQGEFAWVIEFEQALEKGMAFKIKLPSINNKLVDKIDWLLVLGVKIHNDSWDNDLLRQLEEKKNTQLTLEEKGTSFINQLIQSHYYTPAGFSLMTQGAITKNSESGTTDNNGRIGYQEDRYKRFIHATSRFSSNPKTDQQLLAEALGIDIFRETEHVLKKISPWFPEYNFGLRDYQESIAMNTALFPGTGGYYIDNILSNPSILNPSKMQDGERRFFREWFNTRITGRGLVPAIKIGSQPYSILLASNFQAWEKEDKLITNKILYKVFRTTKGFDKQFEKFGSSIYKLSDTIYKNGQVVSDENTLSNFYYVHPSSVNFQVRHGIYKITNTFDTEALKQKIINLLGDQSKFPRELLAIPGIRDLLLTFYSAGGKFLFNESTEKKAVKSAVFYGRLSERLTLPKRKIGENFFPKSVSDADKSCNYIEWISKYYIWYRAQHRRNNLKEKKETQFVLPFLENEDTLLANYLIFSLLHQLYQCALLWIKNEISARIFSLLSLSIKADFKFPDKDKLYGLLTGDNRLPFDWVFYTPMEIISIIFNLNASQQLVIENITNSILKELKIPKFLSGYFNNKDITIAEHIYYNGGSALLNKNSWNDRVKPEIDYLNQIQKSYGILERMPTARLERCFVEHLDTLSYRLDAWRTAFIYDKLVKDRQLNQPNASPKGGLYIGAYGWLTDIQRNQDNSIKQINNPDSPKNNQYFPILKEFGVENDKVFLWEKGAGFIHAPSLAQAQTGAVLRTAHYNRPVSNDPSLFAVDLSSEKVRKGLHLLEGIQKGQELGALLGYQFERSMQDKASASESTTQSEYRNLILEKFRKDFCFKSGKQDENSKEKEDRKFWGGNWPLTDGLLLIRRKDEIQTIVDASNLAPDEKSKFIERFIAPLEDSLDGLKDLLVAESVHQYAQGNVDKASAILQSLSNLEVPPILDFIKTPRSTQISFLNRIAILFDEVEYDNLTRNPWKTQGIALTLRALAEPFLNYWLGGLISNPENIQFKVYYKDAEGVTQREEWMSLADLKIQPIDLLYLVEKKLNVLEKEKINNSITEIALGASELDQRIAFSYRKRIKEFDKQLSFYVQFNEKSGIEKSSLGNYLPLIKYLKEVVDNARPMLGTDFDPNTPSYGAKRNPYNYHFFGMGTRPNETIIDIGWLTTRLKHIGEEINNLIISLKEVQIKIKDIYPELSESELVKLKIDLSEKLFYIAGLGLTEAVPVLPFDIASPSYLESTKEKINQVIVKLEQFLNITESKQYEKAYKDIGGFNSYVASFIEKFLILFSGSIKVFPAFTLGSGGPDSIERRVQVSVALSKQELSDQGSILRYVKDIWSLNSKQLILEEWLQGTAEVRSSAKNIEIVKMLFESLSNEKMSLQLIQTPYEHDDYWLGGPFKPIKRMNSSKVSSVLFYALPELGFTSVYDQAFSGLIVDEWTEVIPTEKEETGIAVNYDQPPLSQPPQALLLAVSGNPNRNENWKIEEICATILYTFSRAILRGVSTDQIVKANDLGISLPALYSEQIEGNKDISLNLEKN